MIVRILEENGWSRSGIRIHRILTYNFVLLLCWLGYIVAFPNILASWHLQILSLDPQIMNNGYITTKSANILLDTLFEFWIWHHLVFSFNIIFKVLFLVLTFCILSVLLLFLLWHLLYMIIRSDFILQASLLW
jgi:hypothetical protein